MTDTNVVAPCPRQRARDLVRGWRAQPLYVLAARSQALLTMQRNGVRLPSDVHDAWLQMNAIVLVTRREDAVSFRRTELRRFEDERN